AFDGFRAGGTHRVAAVRFKLFLGGHSSISRLSTAVEHEEPGMVTLQVAMWLKTGCEYFLKFVNGGVVKRIGLRLRPNRRPDAVYPLREISIRSPQNLAHDNTSPGEGDSIQVLAAPPKGRRGLHCHLSADILLFAIAISRSWPEGNPMKSKSALVLLACLISPLLNSARASDGEIASEVRDGHRTAAIALVRQGSTDVNAKLAGGTSALLVAVR